MLMKYKTISLMLLLSILLSACSPRNIQDREADRWTEDVYASAYLPFVGKTTDELYDALNISKDTIETGRSPFHQYLDHVRIPETDDYGRLSFFLDGETNQFYSFSYEWEAPASADESCSVVEELLAYYTVLYGDAFDADAPQSVSNMLTAFQNVQNRTGKYRESWSVPGSWHYESLESEYPGKEIPMAVRLEVEFSEGSISYKLLYFIDAQKMRTAD